MNLEKKKVKIPWMKVFLQGYRGGIPWIAGGTIKGLQTLIDRDFYGPNGMEWDEMGKELPSFGLFLVGFATCFAIFGMVYTFFSFREWPRFALLLVLTSSLYLTVCSFAICMGVGSALGVFAVATGKESPSTLGLLLISLPLAWYGGKASWHLIVNYPKTIQWCRESTKLHETVDELQKKVEKGLNG